MRDDAEKENVDPETGLRSGGGGGGGMTSGNVFGAVRVEDVEAFQSAVKKVRPISHAYALVHAHTLLHTFTFRLYIYVCVCVCVRERERVSE